MKLNWKDAQVDPPKKEGKYLVVFKDFDDAVDAVDYLNAHGDKGWLSPIDIKWYAEMPPLPKKLGRQE